MSYPISLVAEELSSDMKLLLALVRAENSKDVRDLPDELLAGADWHAFVELARHHRVHPYLYAKLKKAEDSRIPPFVVGSFESDFRKNTFLMLQHCGEIATIDKSLADKGIRSIFLKGPLLALDLYGDLSLRTSSDIDMLIPLTKLTEAEMTLTSLGYVKDEYIHTVLNDWKWRHHHTTFYHDQKGIKVELHWRLNPSPSGEPGFERLWHHSRVRTMGSRDVRYLGREDLFMFLVSHGARHGWSRLRWLLDIRQWLLQPIDAPSLLMLLHKHDYVSIGGQAIALASSLFEVPVSRELRELADAPKSRKLAYEAMYYLKRIVNLHTQPLPEDVDRYHKRHLFSLMTWRQKTIFVLSFLYPYPEDAETLPLPKSLHLLYFPLRPFIWSWRKMVGGRQ
ncbi:nucleotidyltransferase family protein [Cohnella soli]|uniref:Nucleotidyltransferase family protein n=1 Tax=Cohnella soli TaxID=425005 RepID=A0ABW0HZV8_9BACL